MSKVYTDNHIPSKQRSSLGKSLQLPSQLNVPIPPSLLQSPYLNSPESIFQRIIPARRYPSEEEERWLQDTIPLRDEGRRARSSMSSPTSSLGRSSEEPLRVHDTNLPLPHHRTSPFLYWRNQASSAWFTRPKVHSAPYTSAQDYFGIQSTSSQCSR